MMARMVAAKRCPDFQPMELEVWYQFLGGYSPATLAEAVDRVCRSDERFPSMDHAENICKQIDKKRQEVATVGQLRIRGQRKLTREPIDYRAIRAAKLAERQAAGPAEVEAVKLAGELEWNE